MRHEVLRKNTYENDLLFIHTQARTDIIMSTFVIKNNFV